MRDARIYEKLTTGVIRIRHRDLRIPWCKEFWKVHPIVASALLAFLGLLKTYLFFLSLFLLSLSFCSFFLFFFSRSLSFLSFSFSFLALFLRVSRYCPGAKCTWKEERTNQKNSGWTSVDRSTKATLSTYNTWIQLSRLQKIYHIHSLKLRFTTKPLTVLAAHAQSGQDLTSVM